MSAHFCVVDCWCRRARPWMPPPIEYYLAPSGILGGPIFNSHEFRGYTTPVMLLDDIEEFDTSCNPAGWPVEQ